MELATIIARHARPRRNDLRRAPLVIVILIILG
jgi:hypothetical protein